MDGVPRGIPGDVGEWRRAATGLVVRSLLTVVGFGIGGLVLFAFVAVVTDVVLVDQGWIRALYPLYLLLGVLVGVNLGIARAIRREARRATEHSGGVLGHVVDRTVAELAIPEEGIETERLRALLDLEDVAPRSGGTFMRLFAGFAMARALRTAGVAAVREQFLRAAREAEARGDATVSQAALREAAQNATRLAFAEQLDVGWGANERFTRVSSALALVSLPVLAALFG